MTKSATSASQSCRSQAKTDPSSGADVGWAVKPRLIRGQQDLILATLCPETDRDNPSPWWLLRYANFFFHGKRGVVTNVLVHSFGERKADLGKTLRRRSVACGLAMNDNPGFFRTLIMASSKKRHSFPRNAIASRKRCRQEGCDIAGRAGRHFAACDCKISEGLMPGLASALRWSRPLSRCASATCCLV